MSKSLEGLKLSVTLEKTASRIREHNDDVSDAADPMLSNLFQPAYAVARSTIIDSNLSAWCLSCLFLIRLRFIALAYVDLVLQFGAEAQLIPAKLCRVN